MPYITNTVTTAGSASHLHMGTSPSQVELTGITKVPNLRSTPTRVDVTSISDTEKMYIKGLKDKPELEFEALYEGMAATTTYSKLKAVEDTLTVYTITLPTGDKYSFSATCSVGTPSIEPEGRLVFPFTLYASTAITETAYTAPSP